MMSSRMVTEVPRNRSDSHVAVTHRRRLVTKVAVVGAGMLGLRPRSSPLPSWSRKVDVEGIPGQRSASPTTRNIIEASPGQSVLASMVSRAIAAAAAWPANALW